MRNLRNRYNYQQRTEFQNTSVDLRRYVVPLLLKRQGGVCAVCKQPATAWDIDHLLYNPMMTINELRLLCIPCHHNETDYTHLSNNY